MGEVVLRCCAGAYADAGAVATDMRAGLEARGFEVEGYGLRGLSAEALFGGVEGGF